MKSIEIIELRSTNIDPKRLESQLRKLIGDVGEKPKRPTIRLYRRAMLDSDLSVHLVIDSKETKNGGSQLGLRIGSALKAYGLVNHKIWIEMQG